MKLLWIYIGEMLNQMICYYSLTDYYVIILFFRACFFVHWTYRSIDFYQFPFVIIDLTIFFVIFFFSQYSGFSLFRLATAKIDMITFKHNKSLDNSFLLHFGHLVNSSSVWTISIDLRNHSNINVVMRSDFCRKLTPI